MKHREYLIFTLILVLCTSSALFVGIKISDSKKDNSYFDDKTRRHVDTISMMLEQTSGAGDYVMTTRDSWPTEGYFFNSELSKCENGGELSWDDTNKRVLMSGNTSDKCYVYFDKPLEFYLDNVLFQAAPNMTWEEWLNSSYSDNWSYKSQIVAYSGPENNTCSSGAYYPYCLGKKINDNLFVIGSGEFAPILLLTKTLNGFSYNGTMTESFYTDETFVIMRNKIIKHQLQLLNNYFISLTENNYFIKRNYIIIVDSLSMCRRSCYNDLWM